MHRRRPIAALLVVLLAATAIGLHRQALAECEALPMVQTVPPSDSRGIRWHPMHGWTCTQYAGGVEMAGRGVGWWPL